ncbi:MAG: NAD(P)/FAD-dependent oxidoreductase [Gammaproteobacteria bacterium]|nr:NAD(P)/FAD-dependent oxidoreductase [Gammaproteobacteria bacterium]
MKAFEANRVITQGGSFDADLVLFMPGMTGNAWFDNSRLPRSEGGLIRANRHCKVESLERVYVAGDSGSFPGPDWMPKQAHMADLQAVAAARNLIGEFNGTQTDASFKVELICIVDSNDKGILVSRSEQKNFMLPASILLHWMKRAFERLYLRQYR